MSLLTWLLLLCVGCFVITETRNSCCIWLLPSATARLVAETADPIFSTMASSSSSILPLPLLLLASMLMLMSTSSVHANPDAKRLYDDLLSHYNRLIRPVSNNSEVVTVRLGLHLSQLIDLVSVRFIVKKSKFSPLVCVRASLVTPFNGNQQFLLLFATPFPLEPRLVTYRSKQKEKKGSTKGFCLLPVSSRTHARTQWARTYPTDSTMDEQS